MSTAGRPTDVGAPQAARVRFVFDPAATLAALAGHRRRYAAAVALLGTDELSSPSRCVGWSVADVLRHGVWADNALRRTWTGDRSLVEGFDPRRTPDEFVRLDRDVPDVEVATRFVASSEEMVADLESAGPDRYGAPAVSPLGDVPWWLAAVHLGWDTWIHERDVLVPLGRAAVTGPSETVPVLAYGLLLASFFAGRGPLAVRLGPVRVHRGTGVTEAGPAGAAAAGTGAGTEEAVLVGDSAEVVDGLSGRGALTSALTGPADVVDRLGGMARYFATAP